MALAACRSGAAPEGWLAFARTVDGETQTCVVALPDGAVDCPDALVGWYPGPRRPGAAEGLVAAESGLGTWWPGQAAVSPWGVGLAHVRGPRWSHDGARILARAEGERRQRGIFAAEPSGFTLVSGHELGDHEVDVAPDGRLAMGSGRSGSADVFLLDADGGATRLSTSDEDDFGPVWSPDGSMLAFMSHREGVARPWLWAAGVERPLPLPDEENVLTVEWAPSGDALAVTSAPAGGEPRWRLIALDGAVRGGAPGVQPAFSPDGRWVAWSGEGGIHLSRPDGSEARVVAAAEGDLWLPRWWGR
jgi:Tol biopolymer transport system component